MAFVRKGRMGRYRLTYDGEEVIFHVYDSESEEVEIHNMESPLLDDNVNQVVIDASRITLDDVREQFGSEIAQKLSGDALLC